MLFPIVMLVLCWGRNRFLCILVEGQKSLISQNYWLFQPTNRYLHTNPLILLSCETHQIIPALIKSLVTLPETNPPLRNNSWKTTFLLGRHISRGELLVLKRVEQRWLENATVQDVGLLTQRKGLSSNHRFSVFRECTWISISGDCCTFLCGFINTWNFSNANLVGLVGIVLL